MDNETEDTGEQPVDIETNLEDFEKEFYPGKAKELDEPEEVVEDVDEEEVLEESEEVEALETDEEVAEEEEEEEKPQPKKKHSAKERIDNLTAEKYEERRAKEAALAEAAALKRELETLKAGREEKEEPEALRTQLPPEAPNPDATDKDGNPIYELGEFDPKYIRDLTKFTIAEETKAAREAAAQKEWEEGVAAAQQELANSWVEKVEKAEEAIPTLREDIVTLTDTFEKVDPNYGEYLAMTIMQCDNGPEIMHYFSNNIGEAQKIVASGPAAATLAIGRLEAMFTKPSTGQEEQKRNKRVSNAPNPPESGARGVNGRQVVRPDTDNLEAFETIFYPPKK